MRALAQAQTFMSDLGLSFLICEMRLEVDLLPRGRSEVKERKRTYDGAM